MHPRTANGFTLIELLVVIAIVGVLAVVAIPAYTEQVAKSRRADAIRAIGELQLQLERWRADNPTYDCDTCAVTSDFYDIQFADPAPTATTYTVTAEPKDAQDGDRCGTYTFAMDGGVVTKTAAEANCGI